MAYLRVLSFFMTWGCGFSRECSRVRSGNVDDLNPVPDYFDPDYFDL